LQTKQYRAFSFVSQRPVIIGLIVSQALSAPVDTLTSFLVNAFSRHNEFQADKFALDLSNSENAYVENLKLALVKLGSENKSVTDVDPFYSAYHHSHPVSIS
jgi:STE24 endopeptidase